MRFQNCVKPFLFDIKTNQSKWANSFCQQKYEKTKIRSLSPSLWYCIQTSVPCFELDEAGCDSCMLENNGPVANPSFAVPPLCYKMITHHNPGKTTNGVVKRFVPTGTSTVVLQDTWANAFRIPLLMPASQDLHTRITANNGRHSGWTDTTQMLA